MRYWSRKAGDLVLRFPAPCPPLSINQANRLHWAAKRKKTDPWRDLAILVARQAVGQSGWKPEPVTIQVALPFRDRRRRDPHNYTGTVVKALVDGLVRGGVIPDDSPEWATILEPDISVQPDTTKPLEAMVTIRPRSQHGHPDPAHASN